MHVRSRPTRVPFEIHLLAHAGRLDTHVHAHTLDARDTWTPMPMFIFSLADALAFVHAHIKTPMTPENLQANRHSPAPTRP